MTVRDRDHALASLVKKTLTPGGEHIIANVEGSQQQCGFIYTFDMLKTFLMLFPY